VEIVWELGKCTLGKFGNEVLKIFVLGVDGLLIVGWLFLRVSWEIEMMFERLLEIIMLLCE
jgi:hypothetical protein